MSASRLEQTPALEMYLFNLNSVSETFLTVFGFDILDGAPLSVLKIGFTDFVRSNLGLISFEKLLVDFVRSNLGLSVLEKLSEDFVRSNLGLNSFEKLSVDFLVMIILRLGL